MLRGWEKTDSLRKFLHIYEEERACWHQIHDKEVEDLRNKPLKA